MSKKQENYHGEPQKPNGGQTGRNANSQSPVDKQFQQAVNNSKPKAEESKHDSASPIKTDLFNMHSMDHTSTIENNGDAIANPIHKDDLYAFHRIYVNF